MLDAGFQMNHFLGICVEYYLDAGCQNKNLLWPDVHISLNHGFYLIHELKTGIQLDPDTMFLFIRQLRGMWWSEICVWGQDGCLGLKTGTCRLFMVNRATWEAHRQFESVSSSPSRWFDPGRRRTNSCHKVVILVTRLCEAQRWDSWSHYKLKLNQKADVKIN